MKIRYFVALLFVFASAEFGQGPSSEVRQFIKVDAPVVVLEHVRIIDGTGAAPVEDQAIVISGGKIAAVGSLAAITVPAGSI